MALSSRTFSQLVKMLQLRPVKHLEFQFDPYHQKVRSIREVLSLLHSQKVMDTNAQCSHKVVVKSNRCEPIFTVDFNDGSKYIIKTENLTTETILGKFSMLCYEKDPKRAAAAGQRPGTKTGSGAGKKK